MKFTLLALPTLLLLACTCVLFAHPLGQAGLERKDFAQSTVPSAPRGLGR